MKTLEFIYQETEIHFLVNPLDKNVMVNATEMAKIFNKRPKDFLRLDGTKIFIDALIKSENTNFDVAHLPHQTKYKDVVKTTNKATYFHRKLALKFAAWLDVNFDLWIIYTIDSILFDNYNKRTQVLKEKTATQIEIEKLEEELSQTKAYKKIQELKKQQTSSTKQLNALDKEIISNQLDLFKGV
jgi:hypothetical protein